jgi:hypothetical protein
VKKNFKRILQEPLFHFVILGFAIFVGYSMFSNESSNTEDIVITNGDIASIIVGFTNSWGRQPTEVELDNLIRERVKQEVYCREAIALGLDKGDVIIRRRLQQKMEFILNDNIEKEIPSDSELQNFLLNNSDKFRLAPQFTFKQVFLDPEKRGSSIEMDAMKVLDLLNKNETDFQKLSDQTLLPFELVDARSIDISNQFGNEFALQLDKLPTGKWYGPVKSAYGLHLVLVSKHTNGDVPKLSEIREEVIQEWESSRLKKVNEKSYQELLKNYKVIIEGNKR